MLRGTAATIVVATLSTVGALSARALRSRGEATRKGEANRPPAPQTTETLAVNSVAPSDTTVKAASNPNDAREKAAVAATPSLAPMAAPSQLPAKKATTPLAPVIAMGETIFAEGVVATRSESGVTLAFDTPVTRTRTPEKFERFLRATLPNVYGRDVETALATIPLGALMRQGDLLTELPTRGIRVPVKDAGTLIVYPETRPGQDGPLVVRYRTALTPPGD